MSNCTAKNGINYVMIENSKTWFVDFPTIENNKLVYNSPHQIPTYVKKFLDQNYTINF